jgi:hypothetical protein
MSARQVRLTTQALLKDPAQGLSQAVAALAAAEGATGLSYDFNFVRASLSGKMLPSGKPNIAVRARGWRPDQKLRSPQRDSTVTLEIMAEFTGADPAQIEDQVEITAIAVAQVLDSLRAYSDAHGGTVLDVQDPISFDIGQFGGPTTTDGFVCSANILERSLQ